MMTINENFKIFKGLKVAIVGDITNSRVAKSNMELLHRLGSEVYFSGPEYWYSKEFDKYGKYEELDKLISEMDVMMLLRVQHERHSDDPNEKNFNAKAYHEKYGINNQRYQELKPNRSEEHTSELQSRFDLVCRLLLEKK